ncbi:hypothetical protein Taro_045542 [Colocasia esculenta]|uniref:Uncharacterized protein n=1 Tax=Colocasia esculenta TaxID=4460 RepID=A0A843WMD5_COLES|nr:hypothetical protein [Colocasia esculenta]
MYLVVGNVYMIDRGTHAVMFTVRVDEAGTTPTRTRPGISAPPPCSSVEILARAPCSSAEISGGFLQLSALVHSESISMEMAFKPLLLCRHTKGKKNLIRYATREKEEGEEADRYFSTGISMVRTSRRRRHPTALPRGSPTATPHTKSNQINRCRIRNQNQPGIGGEEFSCTYGDGAVEVVSADVENAESLAGKQGRRDALGEGVVIQEQRRHYQHLAQGIRDPTADPVAREVKIGEAVHVAELLFLVHKQTNLKMGYRKENCGDAKRPIRKPE